VTLPVDGHGAGNVPRRQYRSRACLAWNRSGRGL